MSLNVFFFYLFGLTSLSYIAHLGYYLISASFYDIWQSQRRHRRLTFRTVTYLPRVTVLVPAHNEELVIVRCLESIFASTYPDIDVIVVNDASTDGTRRMLTQYVRLHPAARLRVIHKRINVGKGGALNSALRRYVRSELVMMLDADSILSPNAVENAVSYFSDSTVAGVAANVQIINEHTTLSILQKFEHMIGYRSKKAYSMTNCEFVIGGVASTYRTSAIRAVGYYDTDTLTEDISLSMKLVARGNRQNRIIYGSDIMAMTEPVENLRALFRQRFRWKYGSLQNIFKHTDLIGNSDNRYTPMLTMYRLPMAILAELTLLLLPFTWCYAIYLTFQERSLLLIGGAYLTVTLYMFMTLWFDEHIRFVERLYLSIYIPICYFVFYIMDVVQIISVVKCLFKVRSLSHQRDIGSTWISPTRIGGEVTLAPTGPSTLPGGKAL
jgi:cellulose synthase/poly-beta-1,6-N-acetylglucosamine synthase-like glycosyltransferase